jgi:hypothetical protein
MRLAMFRALVVALAVPALAGAQDATSKWSPWIGCWASVSDASGPVTCVVPGESADVAEILTLTPDSVLQRSTLTADGVARAIDAEGCRGSEVARLSEDGSRVFVSGEVRCGDGPSQRTTGVMSISESGQWIDVNGVQVGEQHSIRVRRSQAAIPPRSLPEEMQRALARAARAVSASRLAAALPLTIERVVETSSVASDRVAEAWMLESSRDGSRPAPVSAAQLRTLEDAGVPNRVIDVVVALSYPQHFQVALAASGGADVATVRDAGPIGPGSAHPIHADVFDYSVWRHGRCYTYSCYAYMQDWTYWRYGLAGWGSYGGWGMYPGWGYNQPIVIVRPSPGGGGGGGGSTPPGGRAEKGEGYRRNGSGGQTASPRTAPASTTARESSAKSGGTSSGESKTRTAKPRKP